MPNSARVRAEKLFSARRDTTEQQADDKKRAQKRRAEQVSRLRGLRLAKEVADASKKAEKAKQRT